MKRITEMYAFVTIDEDGDEAVPAAYKNGMMLPLVGADIARVESLIPIAREIAQASGRSIKILKFSHFEQIGEVNP